MPISLTVSGSWVYVLDAGSLNIAGFRIWPWGELTHIAGSDKPLGTGASSPEMIGFGTYPVGNVMVVTDKGSGKIYTYTVNFWGIACAPKTTASSGPGPYGFAFNSKDDLVVSEAGDYAASSYDVSSWGTLTPISKSVSTTGSTDTPCWVAITYDGKLAYTGNGGSGTVSSFRVGWDGSLTLISANAAGATYAPSLDLAFSRGDGFIYLLSANAGFLYGFKVNHSTGALTWVATVSVPTSGAGLAAS
jgi:6-phosphogluconolactonase